MAEDLQQGPQELGEGAKQMADLAREIPQAAQESADERFGADTVYRSHQDFIRSGMDASDPNNYGPDGAVRLSEDKAREVAYTEATDQDPAVKDVETVYSNADADLRAKRQAREDALRGSSDTAFITADQAVDDARDRAANAKVNRDEAVRNAEQAYEAALQEEDKAA